MKKILALVLLIPVVAFAQTGRVATGNSDASTQKVQAGDPDATRIGVSEANQELAMVSVSRFEDAAFWYAGMPLDQGLVTIRSLPLPEGAQLEKEEIPGEKAAGITESSRNVLGVKVNYFKRGPSYFTVHPLQPLPVEGIVKTISVWVVGRNYNHVLKIFIEDYFGRGQELTLGKLNFMGWKKLTVAIPPAIAQTEYHYTYKTGIKITGFKVECDPLESYGTYYIYLDDLRCVTDLFGEVKRDPDDMSDSW